MHVLPWLVLLALAGCGSSGSVSGKVTYKDKPLAGGTVMFFTSDQKVKSAVIGLDGTYRIDKVTPGPARIGVTPPITPPKMPMGMKMDAAKMGGAPADAAGPTATDTKPLSLPEKYQDPEKSGLTCTVTSGPQQHNIELK
jgi:hypothetical protein